MPLSQYTVNEDANPQMISKRSEKQLIYQQEVAIRYLRPPTPPTPGDIIVTQEDNIVSHPAPPLIIRQQPARPATPQPLVVREAPPQLPPTVGRKIITISGRHTKKLGAMQTIPLCDSIKIYYTQNSKERFWVQRQFWWTK